MPSYFDRLRAAGGYNHAMPRPDPRGYEQFAQFTPEQVLAQQAQAAANGGGSTFDGSTIPTTGPVISAQPSPSAADLGAFAPNNPTQEMLIARSRGTPRGQQMLAGDQGLRQQLAGLDQNATQNDTVAQNSDNGAFINALRLKFAGTPLAGKFDYIAGLHQKSQAPPPETMTAAASPKPEPVSTPGSLQPAIQRYAKATY